MRKVIYLAAVALVAMMIMVPAALAQESTMMMGSTSMMGSTTGATVSGAGSTQPLQNTAGSGLPVSGGPAILLPAAALLLGSGILTFAVLRRR